MKSRRPLSDVPEEPAFLRADEACDACASALRKPLLARMRADGALLHRPTLAMALAYSAPSGVRIAFKPETAARAWAAEMLADERFAEKAKGKGSTEAELIDAALEAGLELGLDTLPAAVRGKVDVPAARKLARSRLLRGAFRQNLAAYDASLHGLEVLVSASRAPSMAALLDPDRLASMFGLTGRQAQTIVREAEASLAYGPKNTKARMDSIRRSINRRVKQALEARAEVMGQTLGREAISTAQQALFEIAQRQGLLTETQHRREWVTRHDERVCPICDSMDGLIVAFDQTFEDADGEEYFQPPAHPMCRCSIRLVTKATPKRQTRSRAA